MTREATGKSCLFDIATDIENVSIWLDELTALLQLYNEHRDNELDGVDPKAPSTVAVLITRQHLGFTLLRPIDDKASNIRELAVSTSQRAYALARSTKCAAAESEG